MFVNLGGRFAGETQSADIQRLHISATTKKRIINRISIPAYEIHRMLWPNDTELQRHYWVTSLFLPIGTIFVLALVFLLMVLFKQCPQIVAAIMASILSVIIIFTALVAVNHMPVYV